jgi:hypothetical protein
MKRIVHRTAAILWPAFLVAAVLEILVFAFVDPASLHTLSGAALTVSDTTVYSIAFFMFWGCTSAACALTVLLERGADELNSRRPLA